METRYRCSCSRQLCNKSSLTRHKLTCSYVCSGQIALKMNAKKRKVSDEEKGHQLHNNDSEEVSSDADMSQEQSDSSLCTESEPDREEEEPERIPFVSSGSDSDSSSDSSSEGERKVEKHAPDAPKVIENAHGHFEESNSDLDRAMENKSEMYPFANMESALLYLWANAQPRISKRKLQGLLDVLHTAQFNVQNLPKSSYFFKQIRASLPKVRVGM